MEKKELTEEELKAIDAQNETTLRTRMKRIEETVKKTNTLIGKTKEFTGNAVINNSPHAVATISFVFYTLAINAQTTKEQIMYFALCVMSYFIQNFLQKLKIQIPVKNLGEWVNIIGEKTGFSRAKR